MRFLKTASLIGAIACLLIGTTCLAQSYATVTDPSCTDINVPCQGTSDRGCNSTTFTVPNSGDYLLWASMDNCDAVCSSCNCLAEAYVYEHGTTNELGRIHNDCGGSCQKHSTPVNLAANTQYDLYSCKVSCPGTNSCSGCASSGVARASVTAPGDQPGGE